MPPCCPTYALRPSFILLVCYVSILFQRIVFLSLGCSNDPESSADSSIATGRALHAGEDDGEMPDEEATHRPSRLSGVCEPILNIL